MPELINGRIVNFQRKDGGEDLFLINVRIKHLTIIRDTLKVFASSENVAIKTARGNIKALYAPDKVSVSITEIKEIFNPGLEDDELDFIGRTGNNILKFFPDSH